MITSIMLADLQVIVHTSNIEQSITAYSMKAHEICQCDVVYTVLTFRVHRKSVRYVLYLLGDELQIIFYRIIHKSLLTVGIYR
jgi:hypothetical protein